MRANARLLGERILAEYPALHQFEDAVSPRIEGLLRRPSPAQIIAIMGIAKRWQQARTAVVVAECGTGKTLISLGAMHVHSGGKPFTVPKGQNLALTEIIASPFRTEQKHCPARRARV